MERQAHVQAHGDVGDVSPECKIDPPATREGSKKFALITRTTIPHGCRNAARYRSADKRTPCREDWRPKRKALPTRQHLGTGELSDQRYCPFRSGTW